MNLGSIGNDPRVTPVRSAGSAAPAAQIASQTPADPADKMTFQAAPALAESAKPAEGAGIRAPGATLQKLAGDFKFAEGLTCDKEGNVFFTDQPNNRILKWSTDGKLSTFKEDAGRANGMIVDDNGNLLACADEHGELWSIAPTGQVTTLSKGYDGHPFNGPNDVTSVNGKLYMTDPFYPRDYWPDHHAQPQDSQQVYYMSPDHQTLKRVTGDLTKPNGIVGTPDGKTLYVSDIGADKTWAYDVQPNGDLSNKRLAVEKGSDGMTLDDKGNLYLTGEGVFVFNPQGKQIDFIDVPQKWVGNICFGGKDKKTLFMAASEGLYSIRTQNAGANQAK